MTDAWRLRKGRKPERAAGRIARQLTGFVDPGFFHNGLAAGIARKVKTAAGFWEHGDRGHCRAGMAGVESQSDGIGNSEVPSGRQSASDQGVSVPHLRNFTRRSKKKNCS